MIRMLFTSIEFFIARTFQLPFSLSVTRRLLFPSLIALPHKMHQIRSRLVESGGGFHAAISMIAGPAINPASPVPNIALLKTT